MTVLYISPALPEPCQDAYSSQIQGEFSGSVSSWLGSLRTLMAHDKRIFEYSYDAEEFRGPAVIEEEVEGLTMQNVSITFQKEPDTSEGHMPEIVTVAYEMGGPKILTSFWTKDTGLCMGGEPILE
jgi:hypothetical protein